MPPREAGGPTVTDSHAAVAALSGLAADDVQGFVLITIDVNGDPTVLTSAAVYRTVIDVLLETAAHLVAHHQLDDPPNG